MDFDAFVGQLPPSLTHLTFDNFFDLKINFLPSSITYLRFGTSFSSPITHLPPALTHLSFKGRYDVKLPPLPHSLTHLKVYQRIPPLPPYLHTLQINGGCQDPLNLPQNLKVLKFHDCDPPCFVDRCNQENSSDSFTSPINIFLVLLPR